MVGMLAAVAFDVLRIEEHFAASVRKTVQERRSRRLRRRAYVSYGLKWTVFPTRRAEHFQNRRETTWLPRKRGSVQTSPAMMRAHCIFTLFLQQLLFICSNILFLQQLLFLQQPLFLQQLLILKHKLLIFAATFSSICSALKVIAASIFVVQRVLFVCRKLFKIAATFKFAAEIIKKLRQILKLQHVPFGPPCYSLSTTE